MPNTAGIGMSRSHASRVRPVAWAVFCVVALLVLSQLPGAYASSTVTILDAPSCGSIGGTWTTGTCTVSGGSIPAGTFVVVPAGITLAFAMTATVTNYGSITNQGVVTATLLTSFAEGLSNYGSITNQGLFQVSGTNNNDGEVNNYGELANFGTLSIFVTAFQSTGFENFATVTNSGTILVDISEPSPGCNCVVGFRNAPTGLLNNFGTLTNSGPSELYVGYNGGFVTDGLVNNYGTVTTSGSFRNDGVLTNLGALNNYGGLVNNNYGGMIPGNVGTIDNDGLFTNFPTGTFVNVGVVNECGTFDNVGAYYTTWPNAWPSGEGTGVVNTSPCPTPAQQTSSLVTVVLSLGPPNGPLNVGQANSLVSKLFQVESRLGSGQTNAACNTLSAFVNEVTSLTNGGVLLPSQDSLLAALAQSIMTAAQC